MRSNLFIVTYKDGDIHDRRRKISSAALKLTEGIGTNYSQTNTKKNWTCKGRHQASMSCVAAVFWWDPEYCTVVWNLAILLAIQGESLDTYDYHNGKLIAIF